ncbi:hypothetical protein LINGRAHAP2_LOCUS9358 [Linum grandiflorum]
MLGHGFKHCEYSAILPFNRDERGDWMLARPEGHKIKAPNFSETATSKQKRKSQKPVPSIFHTYIKVPQDASSSAIQIDNSSYSDPAPAEIPICNELQDMEIEDRKRPRDLTLQSDSGPSKKSKTADIPLQISDFPEGMLDLDPISSDEIEEFAAELAAELAPPPVVVSQALHPQPVSLSTDVVTAARPKRPRKPK